MISAPGIPSNLGWGDFPDISDQLNMYDDFTEEPIFTLNKSEYFDLEQFSDLSGKSKFETNFAVFSLNIRSLPNKINNLVNILSHLKSLPAVLCLQEIWSSHANLEIPGYHSIEFFSRDKDTIGDYNCGGGVGIYIFI